jgi:hypothetical protein
VIDSVDGEAVLEREGEVVNRVHCLLEEQSPMGGYPETISTTALQGSIPSTCPPMLVVFATSSSAGGLPRHSTAKSHRLCLGRLRCML